MDSAVVEDVANTFAKLRMYPYFDICHYILMSIAVKEDTPQSGSSHFSRRHPFSCWLATMLMCFGGAILSNFICGLPLFICFDDTRAVLTATVVWYLINYFPLDILYRMSKFLPIRVLICSLKEIQRARKISMGVHHGLHEFPESAVMCVLLGLLKGCGANNIQPAAKLVMGTWQPKENPLLVVPFTTKISLMAAAAYYAHHLGFIPLPENQLFLAVALIFVYLRVTMILLGLKDPFSPFENITCTVVFGGTVDALRSALERSRSRSAEGSGTSTTSTTPLPMGTAVLSGPSTAHVTAVGGPSSGPSVVSSTGIPSSPGVNGQVGGKDVAGTRQTSDKKRD